MNYQQLLKKYQNTKPFKGRKFAPERPIERPIRKWDWTKKEYITTGYRRSGRYILKLLDDQSIAVCYWGGFAAVLHPDERITLYGNCNGGHALANEVLPRDIMASNRLIVLAPAGKKASWWGSDRSKMRIVQAGWRRPVVLKRRGKTGRWELDNPDEVIKHTWLELDKTRSRELSKEYRIADFSNWLRAYTRLNEKAQSDARGDEHAAAEALKQGDFLTAFHNLEEVTRKSFGYARWRAEYKITQQSIERVRAYIYRTYGALVRKQAPVVSLPDYYNKVLNTRYGG